MQLTPKQIADIVAAGKDDVVFVTLEGGIHPSAHEATRRALKDVADAAHKKGEFFPRVLVLPPGMRVDIVRQPEAVQKAVAKAMQQ